jgi:hypothetical protein
MGWSGIVRFLDREPCGSTIHEKSGLLRICVFRMAYATFLFRSAAQAKWRSNAPIVPGSRAVGKVVRLVDADFDPGQMQALVVELRDNLHNALVKLELRTQDVERLEARNRSLEAELVRLERELTNEAKDAIVARQKAAKRRDRN